MRVSVAEACRNHGKNPGTILARMRNHNMTLEEALTVEGISRKSALRVEVETHGVVNWDTYRGRVYKWRWSHEEAMCTPPQISNNPSGRGRPKISSVRRYRQRKSAGKLTPAQLFGSLPCNH